jgi:hypothetical protein
VAAVGDVIVAAVGDVIVATAGKLAVLCWHLLIKGESYAFAQPSLLARKHRTLELRAGLPPANGRKGTAAGYSLKAVRAAERELAAQSELAYRTMVAAWQPVRHLSTTATGKKVAVGAQASNETRPAQPAGQAARQGLQSPHPALRSAVNHAHRSPTLPRSSPRSRSFVQPGAPP